ncbi:hypothetical protein L210DRAFT_727834 [Boletus edulis BED1]|uniref:Uncharacterized protein n=1 Tax=Boletus edulis BED1 TaxID=1328754 RepID=A0AAD4BE70_BOLED|nr:hypothetical protein L210DRAFT_727834 [Boletus edulis BED1]
MRLLGDGVQLATLQRNRLRTYYPLDSSRHRSCSCLNPRTSRTRFQRRTILQFCRNRLGKLSFSSRVTLISLPRVSANPGSRTLVSDPLILAVAIAPGVYELTVII